MSFVMSSEVLNKIIMIRSKIFNSRTSKTIIEQFILKNSKEISIQNLHQCISTTNFNSTVNQQPLTSNLSDALKIFKKKEQEKEKISEREFLVKLKNDPDTFGKAQEEEIIDEDDIREEKFLSEQPLPSQRLSTKQYADIIKKLINQRRIKEAIDFVEIRMIKEDRVKPEAYIFNLLLGACGRVGYTKKAFMLYNVMKKRGLNIMGGTYTALFNACSNSPWPLTDGLTRAQHLRNIMIEKGHEPNSTTYNAMIKAFGRCGDISTAFLLVDEMLSKKFVIKDDTINFLLQACITDKEAGFRHALLVWRKLVEKNIQPSVHTYNLLLRSIRDCGLGDAEITQNVIDRLVPRDDKLLLNESETKLLDSAEDNVDHLNKSSDGISDDTNTTVAQITSLKVTNKPIEFSVDKYRPNLLANVPRLGNIVTLSEVKKPEDRLFLVGGLTGFLENMDDHNCKPDIKTVTQLLECLPSSSRAEDELLAFIKSQKLRPDIAFYNLLIKKKSMRRDYAGGREVLKLMKKHRYRPDLITYGVLALGCETKEDCQQLIDDMRQRKYSLNAQILGALLYQACYCNKFDYILHVMDLCHTETVNPDKKFIETLEQFKKKCRRMYNEQELSNNDRKRYIEFKKKYAVWLTQVHVDDSEDVHPWQQFRQTSEENPYYKAKDTYRFKPIHQSKFKVKTSPKYVNISK